MEVDRDIMFLVGNGNVQFSVLNTWLFEPPMNYRSTGTSANGMEGGGCGLKIHWEYV